MRFADLVTSLPEPLCGLCGLSVDLSVALKSHEPQATPSLAARGDLVRRQRVSSAGRSQLERDASDAILAAMQAPALDLVGKDTLKQLPALLERADLLMTPDSGPMHIANAMGTRVLGLHAASNPRRSGPYSDIRFCADRYDDAARRFLGRPATSLPWTQKIERPGVMDLVTIADVTAKLDALSSAGFGRHRANL